MNNFLDTLRNAFDAVPICILTLDENLLINYVNKPSLYLIDKSHEDIIGKQFGAVFNCINSYDNENGCGYGSECTNCKMRDAIITVLNKNQTIDNIEINIHHLIDGRIIDSWYKAGISFIFFENKKHIIITLLDITHKKKEELSIRQARDYSRNLLNQVTAMIWKIDRNMKVEYVNKRWEDFTGVSNEEIANIGLNEIIHPEDSKRKIRKIIKTILSRNHFEIEIRLRRKDGAYRSCLVAGTPCYDLNGLYDGYVGTIVDITEHKKAIESLNQYQKLAENSDEIILFIDPDGNIIDANNAAVRTYGYTYEELLGLNVRQIRKDWDQTYCQLKNNNGTGKYFESVHRRKDGTAFNVEVYTLITTMNNKEVVTSIARDITAKKMSEIKLKEQEELFRALFEQSSIGIIFGDNNKKIIMFNSRFEEITGRTRNELMEMNWTEYTHPDDIEAEKNLFLKYLRGEINGYSLNKRYIKPDGSIVWVNLTLSPIKVSNVHNINHLCTIEDITERVHAESKLRESERSKSVMLSNLPGMAYRCNYDKEWTMQFVSDGCFDLTGYKPESLLYNRDLSFNDLIHPKYREHLWKQWSDLLPKKGVLKEEYPITTASGEIKWVYEQGRGIFDEEGNLVALEGLIIDITDRKKKEDEIRYLNYHDVLTGLYNRRFFEKAIREFDKEINLPLSIIVGDINGLKLINDTLGRDHGDQLIISVANILKGCIRENDILARTGGDDFCLLLPGTSKEEAYKIMKNIEKAYDEYREKASYHTNVSLGYATKTKISENFSTVIKSAEDKMYRSKLLQSQSLHSTIIASMKATLYEKSQETEEHASRLIKLSKAVGRKMNLMDEQLNELELLSTLHDIGKIGISDVILNKRGKLTKEEWEIMKKHPEIGYRIAMSTPELASIATYILHHHERYDGTGYPEGLKGEDIPLLSRILAVVDAYDAMTEDRSYRKAMTKEEAIAEIRKNSGTQFDPYIAEIFINIITQDKTPTDN